MRVLVPVFIVAIIAVVVLILVLSDRRKTANREKFAQVNLDLQRARGTLVRISSEVELQRAAQYVDWTALERILREHNSYTYGEDHL